MTFAPLSAVYLLGPLFSPLEFPVTAQNFNFSSVIFVFVTICGAVSWYIVPEDMWLSRRALGRIGSEAAHSADASTHRDRSAEEHVEVDKKPL